MKKIMIAWVAYQRRADCMRDYWGYDLKHVHSNFGSSIFGRVCDYIYKFFKTVKILVIERPDEVWLQLPPSLLLHIAILYKVILNRDVKLVADLHNSMLRPKWMRFPLALNLLLRMDVVLAHNQAVKDELLELGLSNARLHVLEDYPFKYELPADPQVAEGEEYIIFPCSFDIDEPILTVLKAAHLSPIKFYITGNANKFVGGEEVSVPDNVYFTGYLSKSEYESLLLNATIVLGLTTRQNVQLSVANEGLSACKPLILSDTITLRELYFEAAQFVDNDDPQSLVDAINYSLMNASLMSELTKKLMYLRIERWKSQAAMIMKG